MCVKNSACIGDKEQRKGPVSACNTKDMLFLLPQEQLGEVIAEAVVEYLL